MPVIDGLKVVLNEFLQVDVTQGSPGTVLEGQTSEFVEELLGLDIDCVQMASVLIRHELEQS